MKNTDKPKLIKKWRDKASKVDNFLYEYENGIPLIMSVNTSSNESLVSIVSRCGSIYETALGVPDGTAHLLEHLVTRPNSKLRTVKQIDKYCYGDITRPSIETNAFTSYENIYLVAFGNHNGMPRMIDFLSYEIDYPENRFIEFIDNQKKIIHAEISNMPSIDKDSAFISSNFLRGKIEEYNRKIAGTHLSLDEITLEDLVRYKKLLFNSNNIALSVYSPRELSIKEWYKLNNLASGFNIAMNEYESKIMKFKIKNRFDFQYFENEFKDPGDIFFSLNICIPTLDSINYRSLVTTYTLQSMLIQYLQKELREKRNLIYGVELIRYSIARENQIYGFNTYCSIENFKKIINHLDKLIYKEFIDYLRSSEAQRVLNSIISNYIFPFTYNADSYYANELAIHYSLGFQIDFDFDESIKIAKEFTTDNVINAFNEHVVSTPPKIWIEANGNQEYIEKIIKNSKIAKRFRDKSVNPK